MAYTISIPLKDLIYLLVDLASSKEEDYETHVVTIGEHIVDQCRGIKNLRKEILDVFGCDDSLTMRSMYGREYNILLELFGTLLWKGDEPGEESKV